MQNKKRESIIATKFREDLRFWAETDRRILVKILDLMEAVERDPFKGIGKPEPLKHAGTGIWSRRITQEHRLTYVISNERVEFLQARFHY